MRDIVAEATNLTVLLRQIMTGCHFLGINYNNRESSSSTPPELDLPSPAAADSFEATDLAISIL